MKVVILCGGKGTRLREETEFKPKPMVTVGGLPLLWHIMKIYAHYGHKDFILCLGYKGEMIKEWFLKYEELMHDFTLSRRDGARRIEHHEPNRLEDWSITFADTGATTNTGGRVAKIRKYLGKDEDFFLTYGDGVADIDINKTYAAHKEKGKAVTVTAIHLPFNYGVMDVADGHARTFDEKPVVYGRINGGFFVCNQKIFSYLSPDDSCVLEHRLKDLARDAQLAAYEHDGFWYAVNTHKEWEEINRMVEIGKTPWRVWER